MRTDEDIGARLTAIRQARGLSREEVSRRLGKGYALPTVQAHENGRNALRAQNLLQYMALYDIDGHWLLTGEGAPDGFPLRIKSLVNSLSADDLAAWIQIGERLVPQS